MCFSPEGDLIGGIVITAIGIDAVRHLHGRVEFRYLAPLPIILGVHQIDETFVWWQLQGHVSHAVGVVAMWIYLLFALVVLPTVVPAILWMMESEKARRRVMGLFCFVGAGVSVTLLITMIAGHPRAQLGHYHIAYSIGLSHGLLVVGLYVLATCGALLASSHRAVVIFGLVNVVVVVVLARLAADGFTSLWCFYAAVVSALVALFLRAEEILDEVEQLQPI